MSGQDFLSCLSVEQFLSLVNWQGIKEAGAQGSSGAEGQVASVSLGETAWQCLSVQQFFNLFDWQGLRTSEEYRSIFGDYAATQQSPDFAHWQSMSVEGFFNRGNWQGDPPQNRDSRPTDAQTLLKGSVREFFKFVPWDGSPEIGSLPKAWSTPDPTSAPKKTDLTDLSNLFY